MMAFIGVRISWLMFDRNSLLALLFAMASSMLVSNWEKIFFRFCSRTKVNIATENDK